MLSPVHYIIKTLKSPLLLAIILTISLVLSCSKYMSYTLFHYCIWFDDYTLRTTNVDLKDMVVKENQARVNQSTQYLSSLRNTNVSTNIIPLLQPGSGKDVLITIVTIDRFSEDTMSRPCYFTQTIARLIREFERYHQQGLKNYHLNVGIVICDVDVNATANKELAFVEKATSFPVIYRNKNGSKLIYVEPNDDQFDREKEDYAFCLKSSFNYEANKPRFVLMLEDDALPVQNYFSFLEDIIKNRLDQSVYNFGTLAKETSRHDFLYVKLYHPEVLLSFHALDVERLPQLFATGIMLTFVSTMAIVISLKLVRPTSTWSPKWRVLTQLWVYFTIAALLIGRPNLVLYCQNLLGKQLGILTLVPAPSCCTPAILFPDSAIPIIVDRLNSTNCSECYAKDAILDDLRMESNRSAVLIQPNLHRHVGSYSVVRLKENENYRHYLGIEY